MNKKKLVIVNSVLLITILFFLLPQPIHASFLDDIKNNISTFISSINPLGSKHVLTITALVTPLGSTESVTTVNSGDPVTFTITILNDTALDYKYAVLKTNLDTHNLYYIRNIKGAYSMEDKNNVITFPNLLIPAHQALVISFDANVIKDLPSDIQLTIQPQLYTNKSQKAGEASMKTLKAIHKSPGKNAPFNHQMKGSAN